MINLNTYINESLFDEEDIMDNMDNESIINNWYNKLSNESTYREAFEDFWKEISKKHKLVQSSKVKFHHSYIVFETKTFDSIMGIVKNKYIELIEPHNNRNEFTKIYIHGIFVEETGKRKVTAFGGEDVYSNIDRILQRKSKFNDFDEREIYEVTQDIEWVIHLIKKLRKKLYK